MKTKKSDTRLSLKHFQKNAINQSFATLILILASSMVMAQFKPTKEPVLVDGVYISNPDAVILDEYIVVLRDELVEKQAQALSKSLNMSSKNAKEAVVEKMRDDLVTKASGSILNTYTAAINGFAMYSSDTKAVSALSNDKRVAFVEANQMAYLNVLQNNATWGLDRIDQNYLPLNNTYGYNRDGTGVNVYVIDTGIRLTHNDFNPAPSPFAPTDCNGHGTTVAGAIGSTTYGVAKGVQLYSIYGANCQGNSDTNTIVGGLATVGAVKVLPAVVNISLGLDASMAIDNAANNLLAQGITVVTSAGNEFRDACGQSPARVPGVITVGATDNLDRRPAWSNFGPCVDIFAPGVSIRTTSFTGDNATEVTSGTSISSPYVAGAAALVLQNNPNATPAQVKAAIINAANPRVINAGAGSPNRLLNTQAFGGGGNPVPPINNNLTNGLAKQISGASGSTHIFKINVPSIAQNLRFELSGGTGDGDMHVKYGSQPTLNNYDCRPYQSGNNETCTIQNIQAGTYYVMIHGWANYNNVSLKASFDVGGNPPPPGLTPLTNGVVRQISGGSGSNQAYTFQVPAGASNVRISMNGGNGDADLYVRYNSSPTLSLFDCRPYTDGNNESCDIQNAQAGIYYVVINGFRQFSNVSLLATFQ